MALSPYKDKSLAECKGLTITTVQKSKENGYKQVYIQGPGIDYGTDSEGKPRTMFCLLLGKECAELFEFNKDVSRDCVIRLTVNADGEERWKLGRPGLTFKSVDDL